MVKHTKTAVNGRAVDATGDVAYDPSVNVIALVEANAKTGDALRAADIKFNDSQHAHLKEMATLLASNAERLRVGDLERLAKTREVDVTTGAAQAQQLATAVQTLAVASDKNAEAIRNQMNTDRAALAKQVSDTAATLSAATVSQMKDVNDRIAELQKSQYQGVGKSSVADPQLAELVSEMRSLTRTRAADQGKSAGMSDLWKMIIGAVGLIATLSALGVFDRETPPPLYTPAPAGTQLPSNPPTTVPR